MRCRCSHTRETHEHYRPGRDCGACACRRFTAADQRPLAGLAAVVFAALMR
jgi:hypothetical protein